MAIISLQAQIVIVCFAVIALGSLACLLVQLRKNEQASTVYTHVKRSIVLPLQKHNGASNQTAIDAILSELLTLCGGYSTQYQTGVWLDNGQQYKDDSLLVYTVVPVETDTLLQARLTQWTNDLAQLELYTDVCTVSPSFIHSTAKITAILADDYATSPLATIA